MNKREVLIILNRLKDVAESEDVSSKLSLTHLDCVNLLEYLINIKNVHDRDKELINNIVMLIQKRNSEV